MCHCQSFYPFFKSAALKCEKYPFNLTVKLSAELSFTKNMQWFHKVPNLISKNMQWHWFEAWKLELRPLKYGFCTHFRSKLDVKFLGKSETQYMFMPVIVLSWLYFSIHLAKYKIESAVNYWQLEHLPMYL